MMNENEIYECNIRNDTWSDFNMCTVVVELQGYELCQVVGNLREFYCIQSPRDLQITCALLLSFYIQLCSGIIF